MPTVTSDWVLAEFLNGTSRRSLRGPASGLVRALTASTRATVLEADRASWSRAFGLYAGRPDKSWSFIDCTSIVACEARGIRDVFTHDRHFEQAGLAILIP